MTLPEFRNEPFTDFSKPENVAAMQQALADVRAQFGKTYPLIIGGERITTDKTIESTNPANPSEVVGRVASATVELANRAIEILAAAGMGSGQRGDYSVVNPNDHVNMAQSTNDVFPTSMRVATLDKVRDFLPALDELVAAFEDRAKAFDGVLKSAYDIARAIPGLIGESHHNLVLMITFLVAAMVPSLRPAQPV